MARLGSDKLTEMAVKNAQPKEKSWKLPDGKGLYLEIMPNGAKYSSKEKGGNRDEA